MFGTRQVSPAKICRKFLYLLQKDSLNNEESIMPMRRKEAGNALDPLACQPLRGEGKKRIAFALCLNCGGIMRHVRQTSSVCEAPPFIPTILDPPPSLFLPAAAGSGLNKSWDDHNYLINRIINVAISRL